MENINKIIGPALKARTSSFFALVKCITTLEFTTPVLSNCLFDYSSHEDYVARLFEKGSASLSGMTEACESVAQGHVQDIA